MTINTVIQFALLLSLLLILIKPLGWYIARVYQDAPLNPHSKIRFLEILVYRCCSIDPTYEMNWKQYILAVILFNGLGTLFLFLLQKFQIWLPLNPEHLANIPSALALNTSISFATNTDWQSYVGETTMSYFTRMLGLTTQNFLSSATGISVLIALIRGFERNDCKTIGNFWVDLTRGILYLLIPLSLVWAILLMSQGVLQNFEPYHKITMLNSNASSIHKVNLDLTHELSNKHIQILPMGPVASQEAIKILGTNGGGVFNASSAHPFENPTPLSNFLEILGIILIPAALCYSFGLLVGDSRQGWALFASMIFIFTMMTLSILYAEQYGNPILTSQGVDQTVSLNQSGGNMEGKEERFGITGSAIFAAATTATSDGAINSMHDSYTPVGGLITLWLIQLDEVILGGVGSGLYGMIIFALIAVFMAGLMIGRTPEYLGKKIEIFEMKMASIAILIPPFLVLGGTTLAILTPEGRAGIFNSGPHGFSEILYAFSSTANNNGSAFAGLATDTFFYNMLLAMVMWLGRFGVIIPVVAIAGSLAAKKRLPVTPGSLITHGLLFILFLMGIVIVVGALTYFPALTLGPIIEQLMLFHSGIV